MGVSISNLRHQTFFIIGSFTYCYWHNINHSTISLGNCTLFISSLYYDMAKRRCVCVCVCVCEIRCLESCRTLTRSKCILIVHNAFKHCPINANHFRLNTNHLNHNIIEIGNCTK